mmetsp:Transcript_136688/g.272629  ORF Transcript_136688/g.272629 Transcript_136688/m.272629 type:complete len:254 (-) Transcript_136688:364-1125(-)
MIHEKRLGHGSVCQRWPSSSSLPSELHLATTTTCRFGSTASLDSCGLTTRRQLSPSLAGIAASSFAICEPTSGLPRPTPPAVGAMAASAAANCNASRASPKRCSRTSAQPRAKDAAAASPALCDSAARRPAPAASSASNAARFGASSGAVRACLCNALRSRLSHAASSSPLVCGLLTVQPCNTDCARPRSSVPKTASGLAAPVPKVSKSWSSASNRMFGINASASDTASLAGARPSVATTAAAKTAESCPTAA